MSDYITTHLLPQCLLVSLCFSHRLALFISSVTSAFVLILHCVSSFFGLWPPTFIFFLFSCLFEPQNKPPFYIFYSFIYAFAPLPMPVSVWVLCQPLCQDRSPATQTSGQTEGQTGRAHCHCRTGGTAAGGRSIRKKWHHIEHISTWSVVFAFGLDLYCLVLQIFWKTFTKKTNY